MHRCLSLSINLKLNKRNIYIWMEIINKKDTLIRDYLRYDVNFSISLIVLSSIVRVLLG